MAMVDPWVSKLVAVKISSTKGRQKWIWQQFGISSLWNKLGVKKIITSLNICNKVDPYQYFLLYINTLSNPSTYDDCSQECPCALGCSTFFGFFLWTKNIDCVCMYRVIKTKNLNPKPKTPTWPSIFIL